MDIGNLTEGIIADLSNKDEGDPQDYDKGDYRYCGKCGKPNARIKRNSRGEKLYFSFGCGCKRADTPESPPRKEKSMAEIQAEWKKKQEEYEARAEQERREQTEKRRDRAFSDIRLKKWTFESDDNANPHISSVAKKYVENYYTMEQRNKGLLLYGGVGTGKTYIAACIINALVEKGVSCKLTNFSRLANEGMAREFTEKQNFVDGLNTYDLIVIDDLGSERSSDFMNELVYSVIDSRHKSGKPMIVTTNLSGDNLKHPKDVTAERVYSRLFEMCIPVEVKGADRRKLKLRDADKDLKELLGLTDGKEKNQQ